MIKQKYDEFGYRFTNRDQAKKSGHSGWCRYCDGAIVRIGSKCPVCGKRNFPKRFKK